MSGCEFTINSIEQIYSRKKATGMFLTASVEMKLGKIIGDLGLLLLHSRHRC